MPLCGVPYHAISGYLAKLIRAGRSVAVCDQVEDPKLAKGLVRREVVRVLTPGTLLDGELLNAKENNYLAAATLAEGSAGLAYLDLSTGEFTLAQHDGAESVRRLELTLTAIEPRELLLPRPQADILDGWRAQRPEPPPVTPIDAAAFAPDRARRRITELFQVQSLEAYGCDTLPLAVGAAGAILSYLAETQGAPPTHLQGLRVLADADAMTLDPQTQAHLEIIRRSADGRTEGSLLGVLDRTVTATGGRQLRQWLLRPLTDRGAIRARQDAVAALVESAAFRMGLRVGLDGMGDLERITARIALGSANARDLGAIRDTAARLPPLRALFPEQLPELLAHLRDGWDDLAELRARLAALLADDPPPGLKDGGLIRDGADPVVDELRRSQRDGRAWLADLEARERQRTGIESLKVRYNQVFGYYIEVTRANLAKVPPDYQRKQTLVNAERFLTPELKELETKVLGAEERLKAREYELFEALRKELLGEIQRLQRVAGALALLDTVAALAEVAALQRYVRPEVHDGLEIEIRDGRHPVLEVLRPGDGGRFIPNDTCLDGDCNRLLMITGPNMAGKSTYMRQVALITVMAQVGSFVPAAAARLGWTDRIFTRVGASDNLYGGQSTFMVEMLETARILHNATARSLVLLDEIGRGTSTYDGVSIAWAVAEALRDRARARTLFATHYHELTDLARTCSGVRNYHVAVREWNDQIIFLRKIVEGGTDRSYGIQVAKLAGLPANVIARAKEILANLESGELTELGRPRLIDSPGTSADGPAQFELFATDPHPIVTRLRRVEIERLTPLEALNLLAELKQQAS